MKLGFSFAPGGLLLPYHAGVMDRLVEDRVLTEQTPIAGSSAGAIAVAGHAMGLSGTELVQATAQLSNQCYPQSKSLVQGLRNTLDEYLLNNDNNNDCWHTFHTRPGMVGIAYREVFPIPQSILQTQFANPEDLREAVCFSSTFPWFSSPYPCALDTRQSGGGNNNSQGRLRWLVDGYFTVPRDRFGCPDFAQATTTTTTTSSSSSSSSQDDDDQGNNNSALVDRTIGVLCLPRETMRVTGFAPEDCICPAVDEDDPKGQIRTLLGLATQTQQLATSNGSQQYWKLYEQGFEDAGAWYQREQQQQQAQQAQQAQQQQQAREQHSSLIV